MHFCFNTFISVRNYPFPDNFLSYKYILNLSKHVCLAAIYLFIEEEWFKIACLQGMWEGLHQRINEQEIS